MLGLNSDRWQRLEHAYGCAGDIPDLIEEPKTAPTRQRGDWKAEPWYSLTSALCHQFTVYTASFAAVPHIVAIGAIKPPHDRFDFMEFTAMVEICHHALMAPLIPGDLLDAYEAAVVQAAALTLECLAVDWEAEDYRRLLGSLAALRGKPHLGITIMDPHEEVKCPECQAMIPIPPHPVFDFAGAPDWR